MKTRDTKGLHDKTEAELRQMLIESRDALFTARLDASQMKLKDVSTIARKQDDIARILTVLREKEVVKQ